jgi:hypothetical protein
MDTMTPSVFNAFVHLTDPAGHHHAFGPGDPAPAWALPLVGAHVLHAGGGAPLPVAPPPEDDLIGQAPGFTAFTDEDPEPSGPPTPPPTSGHGSSRPAWAEFARQVGQPVTPEQSRQDIIDALIRNGHIRE